MDRHLLLNELEQQFTQEFTDHAVGAQLSWRPYHFYLDLSIAITSQQSHSWMQQLSKMQFTEPGSYRSFLNPINWAFKGCELLQLPHTSS